LALALTGALATGSSSTGSWAEAPLISANSRVAKREIAAIAEAINGLRALFRKRLPPLSRFIYKGESVSYRP
jgi:hypothetical protein